jgi:hypothetical protein
VKDALVCVLDARKKVARGGGLRNLHQEAHEGVAVEAPQHQRLAGVYVEMRQLDSSHKKPRQFRRIGDASPFSHSYTHTHAHRRQEWLYVCARSQSGALIARFSVPWCIYSTCVRCLGSNSSLGATRSCFHLSHLLSESQPQPQKRRDCDAHSQIH